MEIIVVDDGSTDGTWQYLEGLKDLVAIRTPHWGKDWAVQTAMGVAQGEYVRFLDSDDWLNPGTNADQLALARQSNADVVVAGYEDFYEATGRSEIHPWVECDDFVAQQLGEVPFSSYCAFLFRRSFIQDIPHRQEFALRDDRMFILEVAIDAPRLAVYRKPAFVYRHHLQARQLRTKGFRRALAAHTDVEIIRKAVELAEQRDGISMRRRRAAVSYVWAAVRTLAKFDVDEAAKAADWLFELDPTYVPPVRKTILLAYRCLGFKTTERLIRLLTFYRTPPPGPGG